MTGERQMLLQSLKRAKGRLQVITDQYHALTSITCKVLERVMHLPPYLGTLREP